jgi:uncharacterized membrane protein
MNEQKLAQGLGWFSIGLGLAELLAPRQVSRLTGINDHQGVLRLIGTRELSSGLGILSGERTDVWMWSRVAGDAIDLAFLGSGLGSSRADRKKVGVALLAVGAVTALDLICSAGLSAQRKDGKDGASRMRSNRGMPVKKSIIINRPAEEIYSFWRNFENLPRLMNHLVAVETAGERRSHWVAKGPAGTTVEWNAEIVRDEPNRFIEWKSLPGSAVENRGIVSFDRAPGGRGTVVRVCLHYRPPGGVVGATLAKLFGEAPEKQIAFDLMRFKQLLETGEIARTEGQPAGRARSTSRKYDDFVRS